MTIKRDIVTVSLCQERKSSFGPSWSSRGKNSCVKPVFFFSISRTRPSSPALGVVLFLQQRFRALPPLLPPPSLPVHRKRLRLNRLVPLKLIYHPLHVGKVFWLNIHSFATWISNQNPKLNLKRMRVGGFFHFHSNRFNIHILSKAKKKILLWPFLVGSRKKLLCE